MGKSHVRVGEAWLTWRKEAPVPQRDGMSMPLLLLSLPQSTVLTPLSSAQPALMTLLPFGIGTDHPQVLAAAWMWPALSAVPPLTAGECFLY